MSGHRVAMCAGIWVVYVLTFSIVSLLVGPASTALALLPVAAAAALFGMRAGLLAGLLAFPLNLVLVVFTGQGTWQAMFRDGGLLGSVLSTPTVKSPETLT